MNIAIFSAKPFEKTFFAKGNEKFSHDLRFFDAHLSEETAGLAKGFPVVCAFVSDSLNAKILNQLKEGGTQLIALRSAGFNHVDMAAARSLGLKVVRVPAYSPYAVAEHAVGLMLALNRQIYRAYNRVREGNFSLEGLMGFDFHGKTVGVVGTGKIGEIVAKIMMAFGCQVLATDVSVKDELVRGGVKYVSFQDLCRQSDVVTLHCPLVPDTLHILNAENLALMKKGVMIINTSRGALADTKALIAGLKSGKIGYLGLDVYEEEENLFFEDLSNRIIGDDVFSRLLTFPNVLITGHQAFFTETAVQNIVETTLKNISAFERGEILINEVK